MLPGADQTQTHNCNTQFVNMDRTRNPIRRRRDGPRRRQEREPTYLELFKISDTKQVHFHRAITFPEKAAAWGGGARTSYLYRLHFFMQFLSSASFVFLFFSS